MEGTTENRFIKGPEKPPIREIDTIYGGPYIGGQSRNAQKSYAKEAEGKLEMNWLINSRPSSSSKVDPISFTEEDMKGSSLSPLRRAGSQGSGGKERIGKNASGQWKLGDCVTPKGIIRLAVTMGEEPLAAHTFMEFLVVDRRSAYHGVLGRPALKELWAVTSIHHLCMKFPTEGGIATVRGNQPEGSKMLQKCLEKG
ncbi:Uncharacterized protein Adt_47060 [Abeliophyllum distichum]|uniref:Uncharacterized protein n=1 Tax=Abeliophyllum distichum TaxID=126358 RepID=A0ABD1NY77_9LAMI